MSSQSPFDRIRNEVTPVIDQLSETRVSRNGLIALGAGVLLGLVLGLLIGWVWWPVEWDGPAPAAALPSLDAGQTASLAIPYVSSVADAYVAVLTEDAAALAQSRLAALGSDATSTIDAAIAFYSNQPDGRLRVANLQQLAGGLNLPITAAAAIQPPALSAPAAADESAGAETADEAAAGTGAVTSAAPDDNPWLQRLGGLFVSLIAVALGIGGIYWLTRKRGPNPLGSAALPSGLDIPSKEVGGAFLQEPDLPAMSTSHPTFDRSSLTSPYRGDSAAAQRSGSAAPSGYGSYSSGAAGAGSPTSSYAGVNRPAPAARPTPSYSGEAPGGFESEDEEYRSSDGRDGEEDPRIAGARSVPYRAPQAPAPAAHEPGESRPLPVFPATSYDDLELDETLDEEEEDDFGDEEIAGDETDTAGAPISAVSARPGAEAAPRSAVPVSPGAPVVAPRGPVIDTFTAEFFAGATDFIVARTLSEERTGNDIGEYGIGIPDRNGILNNNPDQVIALEAWLFEKADTSGGISTLTVTRPLLSEYAHDHQYPTFEKAYPTSSLLTAQPGVVLTIETRGLRLDCTVVEVQYRRDGSLKGLLQSMKVDMVVRRR